VIDDASLTAQLQSFPETSDAFERRVLGAYASALATSRSPERNGLSSLQRRSRLVRKAETYVVAHLDESVRMQKLCREVGASARSLEYAFQAVYGTGAMRYLRTVRLNEVRKALLRADGSARATVTAAAMDWGFWHLGEFAAAYRRLFGELPSETLRIAATNNVPRLARPHALPAAGAAIKPY
jgi:AraC family ethanolamine operon transcriptional activator